MGAGHAAARVEYPPRYAPIVEAQRPLLARGKVDEGKFGARRTRQAILRTDRVRVGECRAIARQQQVIAVVDRHADAVVVIGPAAATGEIGGLMHDDRLTASRELDSSGEAGKPGAYDVNDPRHQAIA